MSELSGPRSHDTHRIGTHERIQEICGLLEHDVLSLRSVGMYLSATVQQILFFSSLPSTAAMQNVEGVPDSRRNDHSSLTHTPSQGVLCALTLGPCYGCGRSNRLGYRPLGFVMKLCGSNGRSGSRRLCRVEYGEGHPFGF
jgi:hypothetical protein